MGTTIFVWDPVIDCVTHELDENNNVKAEYHNEPQPYGGVLSQRRGTTTHYHHHDALGSTRFLTDSSGNVTDAYLHDAWGNLVASTGTTVNPFKWVGKYGYYTDNSTAQVYVRAMMYQPSTGTLVGILFQQSFSRSFINHGRTTRALLVADQQNEETLKVLIETTKDQRELSCSDRVDVAWKFSLSSDAPCNGFLVQRVDVTCSIIECQCNRDIIDLPANLSPTPYSYYEAWRIRKGEKTPSTLKGKDKCEYGIPECNQGNYEQSGEVRFFCNTDVGLGENSINGSIPGWTPSGTSVFYGPENDCRTTAGTLTSTDKTPAFWKGFPVPLVPQETRATPASRWALVRWTCCPESETCKWGNGKTTVSVDVRPRPTVE